MAVESNNEVTARALDSVIAGVWGKAKNKFATKADAITDVAWDGTNGKVTKTINGTTSDVVSASTLKTAMSLAKSDVGLGNVDNTSDATKKSDFTGAIADGNTGFVTGDDAYDALALKANLESPALTGTPTAPTPSAGDDSTQIATTAFVNNAVEQGLATADALIYKGTVAGGSTGAYGALTPAANKGWTYKVTTTGKIDGVAVEVGDMLICNDDVAAATAENYETVVSKWDFVQGNTEGIVVGPASSTDGHVALFDGVTGKLVKDGGALGTAAFKDSVSAWQSTTDNEHVPTEKLVSDSLSNKVDKVSGKGLSTNDFTDAYKGDVDANTSARHSHSNKSVIDGITSTDVSNWNGKQGALPTSGSATDTYAINISGSASESTSAENLKKLSLGAVNVLPIAEMRSSTFKAGTFLLNKTSEGGSPYVFGDVAIPNDQWYRFTVNGESSNYCTITLDVVAGGSNVGFGTYKILINNGEVSQVVRVPYESTTEAVGGTTSPVYVDSNGKIQPCSGVTVSSNEKTAWNGKQDALTYADGKYAINISGNADSATSATNALYAFNAAEGSNLANAIKPDADTVLVEYGANTLSGLKTILQMGKKIVLVAGGSYGGYGDTIEYRVPLSFITYNSSDEMTSMVFEQQGDDVRDTSNTGILMQWKIDTNGWSQSVKKVAWASNADEATHATSADKAILDGGGSDIRGTYTQRIENNVTYQTGTPSLAVRSCQSIGNYTDAYNYKYFKIETTELPLANVWSKVINTPKYYYKQNAEPPTYNLDGHALGGSYVGYTVNDEQGRSYGNPTGFTCIAHEDTNFPGLQNNSQQVPAFTGGYFTIDFDVVMTVCNLSLEQHDNPPSTLNLTFGLKIDNGTPSNDRYLGFPFESSLTNSRTTVPFRKGQTSYAHIRMVAVLPDTDGRIYIGAYQSSVSDGSVFMHSENFVMTWINRTFTHD